MPRNSILSALFFCVVFLGCGTVEQERTERTERAEGRLDPIRQGLYGTNAEGTVEQERTEGTERAMRIPTPWVEYGAERSAPEPPVPWGPDAGIYPGLIVPGAQAHINFGTNANDHTGDALRLFAQKVETNFNELYTNLTIVSNLVVAGGGGGGGGGDDKVATNNGTAWGLGLGDATVSRAAAIGADGKLTNAAASLAELNFLAGVTAGVQGQIAAKLASANNLSDIADALTARNNLGVVDVDSVVVLRTLNPATVKRYVIAGGYYAEGDGGEGVFVWNSTSAAATNYGTVFKDGNESATGRWLRVARIDGPINLKWFGVKGDGVTDDTARIVSAMGQVGAGGVLYVPAGTYLATSLSFSKSNFAIQGDYTGSTFKCSAVVNLFITITGNNWRIEGVKIDGDNKAFIGLYSNTANKGWRFNRNTVVNLYGDATIDPSAVGSVTGLHIHRGNQDWQVVGNTFSNILHLSSGTRLSVGVHATAFGWTTTNDTIRGGLIQGNSFDTIAYNLLEGAAVRLTDQPSGVLFDCIVSKNISTRTGKRFLKVIGDGVTAEGNESRTDGTNAYSFASFYGDYNKAIGNSAYGSMQKGVEFAGSFPANHCIAAHNLIVFDSTMAVSTNGIGIALQYDGPGNSGSDILADGNVVLNAAYHTRVIGPWGNVRIINSLGTNFFSSSGAIIVLTNGISATAPHDITIDGTDLAGIAGGYAVRIFQGANVNIGRISQAGAAGKLFRAAGITGANTVEENGDMTPASGDLLQWDGAKWVRLPRGTAGQVLTAGAVTNAWAPGGSGGGGILTNAQLAGRVWLADGATITPDLSLGMKFAVLVAGNRSLAAPINGAGRDGQTFEILFVHNATRTLTTVSNYIFGTDVTGITLSAALPAGSAWVGDYVGFDYLVTNNVANVRASPRGYAFSP